MNKIRHENAKKNNPIGTIWTPYFQKNKVYYV